VKQHGHCDRRRAGNAGIIHEGTLDVTIVGKSVRLGPGSVAYVASSEEHGWKNVGPLPELYLVLELGPNS
jgi:mannose-6-phosphate isomerase-like protein (cupin superfamily)